MCVSFAGQNSFMSITMNITFTINIIITITTTEYYYFYYYKLFPCFTLFPFTRLFSENFV